MLAGVGAFFQIAVNFPPCDDFQHILFLAVQGTHVGDVEAVGLLLQGVDPDNPVFQLLGAAEVGKLPHQAADFLAAADDDIQHLKRLRADFAHVVDVNADEYLFDFIGQVVDLLA